MLNNLFVPIGHFVYRIFFVAIVIVGSGCFAGPTRAVGHKLEPRPEQLLRGYEGVEVREIFQTPPREEIESLLCVANGIDRGLWASTFAGIYKISDDGKAIQTAIMTPKQARMWVKMALFIDPATDSVRLVRTWYSETAKEAGIAVYRTDGQVVWSRVITNFPRGSGGTRTYGPTKLIRPVPFVCIDKPEDWMIAIANEPGRRVIVYSADGDVLLSDKIGRSISHNTISVGRELVPGVFEGALFVSGNDVYSVGINKNCDPILNRIDFSRYPSTISSLEPGDGFGEAVVGLYDKPSKRLRYIPLKIQGTVEKGEEISYTVTASIRRGPLFQLDPELAVRFRVAVNSKQSGAVGLSGRWMTLLGSVPSGPSHLDQMNLIEDSTWDAEGLGGPGHIIRYPHITPSTSGRGLATPAVFVSWGGTIWQIRSNLENFDDKSAFVIAE